MSTTPPPYGQRPSGWSPAGGQPPAGWGQPSTFGPPTGVPAGPPNPAPAPAPAPARRRSTGPLLVGVLIGLVVAVAAGAVLVLTKVAHLGSDTAAVDTRPVSMPGTLDGLSTWLDASKAKGAKQQVLDSLQQRQEHTVALTSEAYGKAYGGAGTGVQGYANPDLSWLPTVIAVRAHMSGLVTGPVADPADLGLAVNTNEVISVGDVECIRTHTRQVPEGSQAQDEDTVTGVCQRSGPAFSVLVYGPGGADGAQGRDRMVALTNAAYQALSAG
jgi:hypothetical protein